MWTDERLFWAWRETSEQAKKRMKSNTPVPPIPTRKKLDYVTVNGEGSAGVKFQLCIGVWDDDKYTPLHRDQLEFHLKQYSPRVIEVKI